MHPSKGGNVLARELVDKLLAESPNWTQNKVASRLKLSSQAMSNRMNAKDLKAGFLAEILGVLGYELVVVPAESKLPNGSYVIGGRDM